MDVEVLLEVAVAEALNVPEAVSEPDIDCVLVLVLDDVAVDVGVAVDVAVPVTVAIATPFLTSTSQRYVVAVNDTEIIDSMSPASANVATVTKAAFSPFEAVNTMSPPPSVFIRAMKRIPGLVGLTRVRVSFDAPLVSSQTCKSALARIEPPSPGSAMTLGPRYRSCAILWGEILIGTFLAERGTG